VAVSIAMFGMTVGAAIVFVLPGWFSQSGTSRQLAVSSLLFGGTIVISFIAHLSIPFDPGASGRAIFVLIGTYALISLPFVFCGIAVSLALTRFPNQVSRLYAADLSGAAIGCIGLILLLEFTDGPTAVFVVAAIALLGSLCFAIDAGARVA